MSESGCLRWRNDGLPRSSDAHLVSYQPSMTIAEVLALDARAADVFLKHGMACVGCAIAPFETLAAAADAYGIQVEELLAELIVVETAGGRL